MLRISNRTLPKEEKIQLIHKTIINMEVRRDLRKFDITYHFF